MRLKTGKSLFWPCYLMERNMENLELRIENLEKKCRTLTHCLVALMCFTAYAGFSGALTMNRLAKAQTAGGTAGAPAAAPADGAQEASGVQLKIPTVVEAQVFVLKDSEGRIRGVWNADDQTTSFAMMHKEKYPIAAISVDRKNASFSLTDVYKGKINLSLVNSVRSISLTDDTNDNNIYMGLSGNGEASFDMVSTGDSSIVIDGSKSRIDMTGDKTTIAMSETVGSTIAVQAQPSSSVVSFLDLQGKETLKLSTIDGKTKLDMISPTTKEEKSITTTPEEITAVTLTEVKTASPANEGTKAAAPASASGKNDEKADDAAKKETPKNSIVNMKTYSPFGEK